MAALTCLLFTAKSNAQKLYIGAKAGVNLSKTSGDNLDGDFKGYFLGGAVVGVKLSAIRVQGELLFTQTSLTTGDNFGNAFGNYLTTAGKNLKNGTFKQSEIAVPVTVGFNLIPKLLWISAGPQFSGVVSTTDASEFVKDTKSVVKKGYVSGVVGAEVQLPFKLNAGVRYVFGLSDMNNVGDVSDSWKSSQVQVHVGITLFNLL
ncbi:outer membrane beta-barrel protein [Taibaiella lutea]|nr:outer membrane beta-barrel protein [Taibaiella lutea]